MTIPKMIVTCLICGLVLMLCILGSACAHNIRPPCTPLYQGNVWSPRNGLLEMKDPTHICEDGIWRKVQWQ